MVKFVITGGTHRLKILPPEGPGEPGNCVNCGRPFNTWRNRRGRYVECGKGHIICLQCALEHRGGCLLCERENGVPEGEGGGGQREEEEGQDNRENGGIVVNSGREGDENGKDDGGVDGEEEARPVVVKPEPNAEGEEGTGEEEEGEDFFFEGGSEVGGEEEEEVEDRKPEVRPISPSGILMPPPPPPPPPNLKRPERTGSATLVDQNETVAEVRVTENGIHFGPPDGVKIERCQSPPVDSSPGSWRRLDLTSNPIPETAEPPSQNLEPLAPSQTPEPVEVPRIPEPVSVPQEPESVVEPAEVPPQPIIQGVNSFRCMYCQRNFTERPLLGDHYRTVHRNLRPFPCPICDWPFDTQRNLTNHLQVHEGALICDICQKGCDTEDTLIHHRAILHGIIPPPPLPPPPSIPPEAENQPPSPPPPPPPAAPPRRKRRRTRKTPQVDTPPPSPPSNAEDVSAPAPKRLKEPERGEGGEEVDPPPQCAYCDRSFSSIYMLNLHVRMSHKERAPFRCTKCVRDFETQRKLSAHFRIHKFGIRTHKCSVCQRPFSQKHFLEQHVLVTGHVVKRRRRRKKVTRNPAVVAPPSLPTPPPEQPPEEPGPSSRESGVSVATSQKLKHHLVRRPFPCDQCPKRLPNWRMLQKHKKTFHGSSPKAKEPEKRHTCEICGAAHSRRKLKEDHVLNEHHVRMRLIEEEMPQSEEEEYCTECQTRYDDGVNRRVIYAGCGHFSCMECVVREVELGCGQCTTETVRFPRGTTVSGGGEGKRRRGRPWGSLKKKWEKAEDRVRTRSCTEPVPGCSRDEGRSSQGEGEFRVPEAVRKPRGRPRVEAQVEVEEQPCTSAQAMAAERREGSRVGRRSEVNFKLFAAPDKSEVSGRSGRSLVSVKVEQPEPVRERKKRGRKPKKRFRGNTASTITTRSAPGPSGATRVPKRTFSMVSAFPRPPSSIISVTRKRVSRSLRLRNSTGSVAPTAPYVTRHARPRSGSYVTTRPYRTSSGASPKNEAFTSTAAALTNEQPSTSAAAALNNEQPSTSGAALRGTRSPRNSTASVVSSTTSRAPRTFNGPRNCKYCGNNFLNKSTLARHMSTYHFDKAKYPCVYCKWPFQSVKDLARHMTQRHGKFMCRYCRQVFKKEGPFNNHVRDVHPIQKKPYGK